MLSFNIKSTRFRREVPHSVGWLVGQTQSPRVDKKVRGTSIMVSNERVGFKEG